MTGSMSFFSSTFMIEEEDVMVNKKQGIVSILECDNNNNNNNNKNRKISSLRRTLSADMSSKKWLTDNGFNPSPPQMKKISSSLQLIPLSISDDEEEEPETESESNESSPTQFDIWNSIISKKAAEGDTNNNMSTPAYVHPLVRRSTSALSEKSLEICTESLGSETGSDGFSFEKGTNVEDDKKVVTNVIPQQQQQKSRFPPPIPSLLRSDLRIMSHRDNGRLVLQAVPISQQNNNFKAQREGGRLVLTFSSANNKQDEEPIEKSEEEEKDYSEAPKNLSGALINVHRLALTVNKPMGLTSNMNETWCDKFNETAQLSLPPRQTMLIPSPFNAYEYYWRPKTMVEQSEDKFPVSRRSCKMEDEKQLVILRGKTGDYLAKGFKESRRRSLLSWKPYCVATS